MANEAFRGCLGTRRKGKEVGSGISTCSGYEHLGARSDTQPNHLLSAPPVFLKLHFRNTADLYTVRRELLPLAQANSAKFTAVDAYADIVGAQKQNGHAAMEPEEGTEEAWGAEDVGRKDREPSECIVDVREYDINYYLRVAIDLGELAPSSSMFG